MQAGLTYRNLESKGDIKMATLDKFLRGNKAKKELKDKMEQVAFAQQAKVAFAQQAKAAYLFAEQVSKFSDDKRSIDTLDLLKCYHAGADVSKEELRDAALAASALAYASALACKIVK
jgi:Tfp pilus assembly protein FimV